MELINAVAHFIPDLVADIAPEKRAEIAKTIVIVCGVAYIADKCFDYLKSISVNAQTPNVAVLDSSTTLLLE